MEAALILDPVKNEVFRAERGMGAFMNNKRLRVSGRTDLENAIIAFGSTMDNENYEYYAKEINAINNIAPMLRRFGSAALDLSYIAAGRFDGYWERGLHAWDMAAGYLILKESGGFISSIDNRDNPVYSRNVVAGSSAIYEKIKKQLQSLSKE